VRPPIPFEDATGSQLAAVRAYALVVIALVIVARL
jgi:hypothetical protein